MDYRIRIRDVSKRFVSTFALTKLSIALGLFLVLVVSFAYIAKQVYDGDTITRDTEILLKINSHSNSFLDTLSLVFTYTGNILSVVIIGSLLSLWLYRQQRFQSIIQLFFSVGGAIVANALLKLLFQRERPELWQLITHESTYSFPSGHALITAALAATVVLIWWKSTHKWLIITVASLYTFFVGVSRLYLCVHYPTDVVAGWCMGVAWVIAVAVILRIMVVEHSKTT